MGLAGVYILIQGIGQIVKNEKMYRQKQQLIEEIHQDVQDFKSRGTYDIH
jgi:hypothetical protein